MYDNITDLENLYNAWNEFIKGKKYKKDVVEFSRNLDVNIYNLYQDLKNKTYTHAGYKAFKINDPKPRDIHKALVRDRLLHHAIYRILYPYFDKSFIHDSYSCRIGKVFIKTIGSGVDFLGWVHFPNHRVLRTATKRRMKRRLNTTEKEETKTSYRGLLSHGNSYKLQKQTGLL